MVVLDTASAPSSTGSKSVIAAGVPVLTRVGHQSGGTTPSPYVDGTNQYCVTQRQHQIVRDCADLRFVFGNFAGFEQPGASLSVGDAPNAIYVSCTLFVGANPNGVATTLNGATSADAMTAVLTSVTGIGAGAQIAVGTGGTMDTRIVAYVDTTTKTVYLTQSMPNAHSNGVAVAVTPIGHPVLFSGQTEATIGPNGLVTSDPLGVTLPATGTGGYSSGPGIAYTRTQVRVATAGDKFPGGGSCSGSLHEGAALSTTAFGVNYLDSAAPAALTESAASTTYYPLMVLGSVAGTQPPVVGLCGDSIMNGSGGLNGDSWGVQACINASPKVPYVTVAEGGDKAALFGYASWHRRRGAMLASATSLICQYGVNDVGTSANTANQLQKVKIDLARIWTAASRRGQRVFQSTLLPRTTSTDSYATATNQTPVASESDRVNLNTWLRGGAPLDPTSKLPVATGTGGALVAGAAGHPLYGVFDTAAQIEVDASNALTLNGGRWITNGTANYPTSDGLHPANATHALAANAVNTGLLA